MSKTLSEEDIHQAAEALGVDPASVRAVIEIESRGTGFLRNDVRPVILFERHIFRRQLIRAKHPGLTMLEQRHPDIVNIRTGGYLGGTREWDRLAEAIRINRPAALESASWGLFQIMGFHWELLGFASVQEFVNAMYRSEGSQLDAFVRFVKSQPGMHRALQRRDWVTFARLYNGPGYAKNAYDTKLASAYSRHSRASV